VALKPLTLPVSVILLLHAWLIPELYAARGAKVLRRVSPAAADAEKTALGFLGDLLEDGPRASYAQTRLAIERGRFGAWLLGEAGAVLVRPGGRRIHCYCVKTTDPGLPASDRVAHLLLALRSDEAGFVTVANLAFSGAGWRLRRRLPATARAGLDAAVALARSS
jgi:hypothetical protein